MKQKIFIILLSLPLLFAGCQSYKQVPYLQGNMQQAAQSDTTALNPTLYDARIMPKDLLTIVVSCPEAPELAEPFNLTVSSPISNTGNKYLTSQPVLQQYLVDNRGNIEFPRTGHNTLGRTHQRRSRTVHQGQIQIAVSWNTHCHRTHG